MSLRLNTMICCACFAIAAYALYMVKFSVQNLQREVVVAQRNLAQEKESLHLLKAEWAYLNRPERLRRLSDAHLNLVPLDSRRMQNMDLLPAVATENIAPTASNISDAVYQSAEGAR
jgi:hypothetical protein